MKKWAMLMTAGSLAAMVLLAGCGGKVKPGVSSVERPAVSGIKVMTAGPVSVEEYSEAAGTIRAQNVSVVSSKVMGTITGIYVKEGDRVTAGQLLFTVDDKDAAARVAAAQAGYRETVKVLEMARQNEALAAVTSQRYQTLYNDHAISKQQMDQVATQGQVAALDTARSQEAAQRAQASLLEAQAAYEFTRVTAPVAGIITAKKMDAGSTVVPGTPVLVVEDDAAFTMEADLDESLAGKVSLGMAAQIRVEALGQTLPGVISEIAPAIDPLSRKLHMKAAVSGSQLKTGLYAQLKLPVGSKEALAVPAAAIVEKGQLTGIYTVSDSGIIAFRIVRLGKQYGSMQEVLSGVQAGDKIIVEGLRQVIDGGIVKEVKE